jgi:hypothetical protein
MRNIFTALQSSGESPSEREFKSVYREPGVRYLRIALVLGFVAPAGFFGVDALTGRLDTGSTVSQMRIALILIFCAGAFLVDRYRELVVRFYAAIVNLFCVLGIQATAPLSHSRARTANALRVLLELEYITGGGHRRGLRVQQAKCKKYRVDRP